MLKRADCWAHDYCQRGLGTAPSVLRLLDAVAQVTVISAQDLKVRMHVDHRTVLVHTRMPEEYQAGHIPGAVNIPAEQMKAEKRRLPKNKSVPIIFYCRGMS